MEELMKSRFSSTGRPGTGKKPARGVKTGRAANSAQEAAAKRAKSRPASPADSDVESLHEASEDEDQPEERPRPWSGLHACLDPDFGSFIRLQSFDHFQALSCLR